MKTVVQRVYYRAHSHGRLMTSVIFSDGTVRTNCSHGSILYGILKIPLQDLPFDPDKIWPVKWYIRLDGGPYRIDSNGTTSNNRRTL